MFCQMLVIRRSIVTPCSELGVLDCMTLIGEGTTLFRHVDNCRRDVALYRTSDLYQYRCVSLKYHVVLKLKVCKNERYFVAKLMYVMETESRNTWRFCFLYSIVLFDPRLIQEVLWIFMFTILSAHFYLRNWIVVRLKPKKFTFVIILISLKLCRHVSGHECPSSGSPL
jgi:hypothetical protein